ncbi:kinase-like domain-containing protein [Flagelloscypha sp. PMI_526]|nr:kinase-like domain-containing protein [Flagelloscypha sp. PMI_526]
MLSSRHDVLPVSLQLHDLEVSEHPFSGGGFSDVYEGKWNGERVCLKCLRVYINPSADITDNQEAEAVLKAFRNEAFLWKQFNHPNIVPFLGVTYTALPNRMALVSSFMVNGDIMKYVKREVSSYEVRLRLLLGAAEGLNYIHDLGFCHHDIKGANILIDKGGNACVADLGIAIVAESQRETLHVALATTTGSGVKGSYHWMPPEIIHPSHFPKPPNSMTRDIYAFGCTMLEVTFLLIMRKYWRIH